MNNHPPPMPPPGAYAPATHLISAAGAPHRRYTDATILGGRYGCGLEDSLLFAAAGAPGYPASAALPAHLQGGGDTTTGLELLRLRNAHSRVLSNEDAARALHDQISAAAQQQRQQQNNQHALQYQASAQQQQATAQRNHDLNLANSIERIMSQKVVQVQEHRLREQLVGEHHQQAVARAAWGGEAGGLGLGGINLLASRAAALSGDGSSHANNIQLNDAVVVALRERFAHRRALEEEAARSQHNQQLQQMLQQQQPPQHVGAGAGSSGDAAAQQHHFQLNGDMSHLLNIQNMSDDELIRLRDGLGLGSRVGAGILTNDSLFERQMMDAHILLNGGGIGGVGAGLSLFQQPGGVRAAALAALARLPDRAGGDEALINQAYLDAAIARRVESVRFGGQQPAVDNGNAISAAYPLSVGGGGSGQRLRYFNNGKEVDMEGNPLPPSNDSGARGNGDSVIPSNRLPGHPLDGNANAPVENNAITCFLYAVVNRVPEIGPALAVLQREGTEPGLIAPEYPNVVDATMTVLRSIQERCARATDEITLDLHRRITGWYVDSLFVIHMLLLFVSLTIIHTHLQQLSKHC